MAEFGIAASVLRKEDDRFLRAGAREIAFLRRPVAHARLHRINIPPEFRAAVFTAEDLKGVKPVVTWIGSLSGWR